MENGMKIGNRQIGCGEPCFVIAEIGINHNGCISTAKKLIDVAISAGADAVKFQKREINLNYTMDELAQHRMSPFGTTNGDIKRALEFGFEEYEAIDRHCRDVGILWSASPWDIPSIEFLLQFDVPFIKVSSARNNSYAMLERIADTGKPAIISCGMATKREIDRIVNIFDPDSLALMACTATYPAKLSDLHLNRILTLHMTYPGIPIGYSGHETGLWTSLDAVAMGATLIERHITLDRTSFGSDHAASIEPEGFRKLIREIRDFETARGSYDLGMLDCEKEVSVKLKRSL